MRQDLNFYLDIRSVKYGFKNIAGSFELDERLCKLEDQIERDNAEKAKLRSTYERVKGKRQPSMKFDIAQIKALLDQEMPWEKIAKAFGVSDSCMRNFAKKNKIYVATSNAVRTKIDLDIEQLKALADQGLSWQQIGDALGVSDTTARNRAIELGITKQDTKRISSGARKKKNLKIEQLEALIAQGLTWEQIGSALNVSDTIARSRAVKYGLINHKQNKKERITAKQINALIDKGLTWHQIGNTLNVSHSTARNRAIELGLKKQTKKVDVEQLKALASQGLSLRKIGIELNASYFIVRKTAIEAGIIKQSRNGKIDVNKLKALTTQNLSWRQIAIALGVDKSSVRERASKLGIIKSDYLNANQKTMGRSKIDIEKLKSLVTQALTWKQIGDALGVDSSSARQRAKKLGIIKQSNRMTNK